MRYIMSVDDTEYYWDPATKQVLRDEKTVYRVIGYADDEAEAKEVILAWL